MKKILITIVSFSVLGLFTAGCESTTSPENNTGVDNTALSKKDKKKEVYSYGLKSVYSKLPDAYGIITIKKLDEGRYSFDLKAYNLEPKIQYALDANILPLEIVFPFYITTQPTAIANKKGKLKMSGVIALKAGETIYVFTAEGGKFQSILRAEKQLF